MMHRIFPLLIALSSVHLIVAQDIVIKQGSGSFEILGGEGHKSDTISIYYHQPASFSNNSKILLVIPGAGRNADDYRDSWVEASEKHDVLIVSPSYAEKNYNYGDYHLGGVVKDLNLTKGVSFKKGTNQVHIDEEIVEFHVNPERGAWMFNDFDRLFEMIKETTGSKQKKYDMFGHSAGGQILHRFVLFFPESKADRILASNAGTYTLPDVTTDFPFGIKNLKIEEKSLKRSMKKQLVMFLGELDNDTETRGRMLRSETADKQGTNRLARGTHFFNYSQDLSKSKGWRSNWQIEVVSGVGHDQKNMAAAAAKFLYGK